LELTLLLPKYWSEAGKRVQTHSQIIEKEGFLIISAPILFEGRIKRHFYPFFNHYIRQVQPDLIHIEEEPYSLAAWQAARAARQLGVPLVFFTWENLLEKFSFPHQTIRKFVLQTAAHAIAGDREAGQLLENAGLSRSKISNIPQYGVNPKLFKKRNMRKLKNELHLGNFTVGYVGRLIPEKGISDLIQAFVNLKMKKATLLIVGNGPFKEKLEAQVKESGIFSQVRWIKAVDQSLIPSYLNCMDVLVLPSITTPTWKEQFGRVLIEAQACEVTVVGSDSGAIPEVIGKAGLIYPEGNISQLAKKLKMLANAPNIRKSLGRKGRKQVLRLFTNQKLSDKIYDIYRRLLKK